MRRVELIVPRPEHLPSYLDVCREFRATGRMDMVNDPDAYPEWKDTLLERYADEREGRDLKSGYVPASTFWLAEGEHVLGGGSIRHRLTESLEHYGGHIGYWIRPSEWGKGYGTLQLQYLLREAHALGIDPALITCNDENTASARVMEKNGAVLQDVIEYPVEGELRRIRRYWAATAQER